MVKRIDSLTKGTALAGLIGSAELAAPVMAPDAAKAKAAQKELRSSSATAWTNQR